MALDGLKFLVSWDFWCLVTFIVGFLSCCPTNIFNNFGLSTICCSQFWSLKGTDWQTWCGWTDRLKDRQCVLFWLLLDNYIIIVIRLILRNSCYCFSATDVKYAVVHSNFAIYCRKRFSGWWHYCTCFFILSLNASLRELLTSLTVAKAVLTSHCLCIGTVMQCSWLSVL